MHNIICHAFNRKHKDNMMVSTPDCGNLTPEQSGGDGEHNGDANGDDVMDIDYPECTVQKIDTKSHAAQFI